MAQLLLRNMAFQSCAARNKSFTSLWRASIASQQFQFFDSATSSSPKDLYVRKDRGEIVYNFTLKSILTYKAHLQGLVLPLRERAAACLANELICTCEDWPRMKEKSKIIASKTLFSDLSAKEAASTSAHKGPNKQGRSNCLIPESMPFFRSRPICPAVAHLSRSKLQKLNT